MLASVIKHMKQTKDMGLRYVPLSMDGAKLLLFTDSSFANARDLRSQLGFVILLADEHGNANVIHYASSRCRRVTRSVMASELHNLTCGFDNAFVIQDLMMALTGHRHPIEAFIDSKTVFEIIAKQGRTMEKRLQIDVSALRESYSKGELARLAWIPGLSNPADALTKLGTMKETPLTAVMRTNKISPEVIGWAAVSKPGLDIENDGGGPARKPHLPERQGDGKRREHSQEVGGNTKVGTENWGGSKAVSEGE